MMRFMIPMILLVGMFTVVGCSEDDDPVQVEPAPEVDEFTVLSGQPLLNRFFRLTSDYEINRVPMAVIDLGSIRVFRKVTTGGNLQPGDLENVAAFHDATGQWDQVDFAQTPDVYGTHWREVELNLDQTDPECSLMGDANSLFWAIDIGENLGDVTELACTFAYYINPTDRLPVGDDLSQPAAGEIVDDQGQPVPGFWYRLKLLKASTWAKNPWSHYLMIRQIYPLGGSDIQPEQFDMRIERLDPTAVDPALDENDVPYLQIFGLDEGDDVGQGERDGRPDLFRDKLFDLKRGLLVFPESFARPFAAEQAQYEANAAGTAFDWEESLFLANHLVPALYEVRDPSEYTWSSWFKLVMEHTPPPEP